MISKRTFVTGLILVLAHGWTVVDGVVIDREVRTAQQLQLKWRGCVHNYPHKDFLVINYLNVFVFFRKYCKLSNINSNFREKSNTLTTWTFVASTRYLNTFLHEHPPRITFTLPIYIQENLFQVTRVGILIVATIYLQLIQNRYMFRSFTVLQCSHQHCVQPVASDVEVKS